MERSGVFLLCCELNVAEQLAAVLHLDPPVSDSLDGKKGKEGRGGRVRRGAIKYEVGGGGEQAIAAPVCRALTPYIHQYVASDSEIG